jgi:hypothetical protein
MVDEDGDAERLVVRPGRHPRGRIARNIASEIRAELYGHNGVVNDAATRATCAHLCRQLMDRYHVRKTDRHLLLPKVMELVFVPTEADLRLWAAMDSSFVRTRGALVDVTREKFAFVPNTFGMHDMAVSAWKWGFGPIEKLVKQPTDKQ